MIPTEQLHRLPAVEDRVGFKKSAIYAMIRDGSFPAPVRIGPRAVRWRESDIAAWLESREVA